jgi:hypothetical protein
LSGSGYGPGVGVDRPDQDRGAEPGGESCLVAEAGLCDTPTPMPDVGVHDSAAGVEGDLPRLGETADFALEMPREETGFPAAAQASKLAVYLPRSVLHGERGPLMGLLVLVCLCWSLAGGHGAALWRSQLLPSFHEPVTRLSYENMDASGARVPADSVARQTAGRQFGHRPSTGIATNISPTRQRGSLHATSSEGPNPSLASWAGITISPSMVVIGENRSARRSIPDPREMKHEAIPRNKPMAIWAGCADSGDEKLESRL